MDSFYSQSLGENVDFAMAVAVYVSCQVNEP